ncbi:hypothetical protein [Shewanella maritima]|uniref:hypothetical protein n=1 Tax=Shewanella maritima TaxID=2520507 RepID=UPI003734FB8C
MLTQILITILVIVVAMTYLRHQRRSKQSHTAKVVTEQYQQKPFAAKLSVFGLIAICLVGTISYWGWNWYDSNTIVRVTIASPLEGQSDTYLVRKKDIDVNQITTVDGLQIRLSNQERLTIAPMD